MSRRIDLIEAIGRAGSIGPEEAAAVLDLYVRLRAVRVSAHEGYSVTHGGFLDREVIRRALAQASSAPA